MTLQSRPPLAALAAVCLLSAVMPVRAQDAPPATIDAPALAAPAAKPAIAPTEFKIDIPTISAIGANVDDATLRDIIAGNIAGHAEQLARLNADSITVPTVSFTFSSPGIDGKPMSGAIQYRNLTLNKIVAGVATSTALDGVDIVGSDSFKADFGKMSTGTLDIGGILAVYGLVKAPEATAFKTIYADFAAQGGTVSSPEVDCSIGPITVAAFAARPLKTSIMEMMSIATAMESNGETPTPDQLGKLLKMYADILSAFKSSPVTFGGLDCSGTSETGEPMKIAFGGAEVSGFEPGTYPGITMENFLADVGADGKFTLGRFTSRPFDLSGPIAVLKAAPDAIDEAWLAANARGLIPAYAGFGFKDFAVDAPNPETPGETIKASIAAFDLSLASYRNGIPTMVRTSAQNLVIDLPPASTDEQIRQLLDLGVTKIDLGFGLDVAWNKDTQSIALNDLSVTGADLATVRLAGTLGNVATALFSVDNDEAIAAATSIVVKSLDLDVLDAGLSDLIATRLTAGQGSDIAAKRGVYGALAQGTIISYLAGAAEAQNIGKAVNDFIVGTAKKLHIGLTARDEPGLGLADFMAAEQDPTQLIGKVDITADTK